MKKKISSLLLSILMTLTIVTSMPFSFESLAAGDLWDGSADTSWYNDTDTSFEISTAEQLAGLASLVNGGKNFSGKTVKLTDDITLNTTTVDENGAAVSGTFNSWTAIGSSSAPFKGNLDGQGYTIYNLYSTVSGLFGYISNGSIKNLNLINPYINSTKENLGSLADECVSTLENIHIKNMNVKGGASTGGIIGKISSSMYYCSAQGNVSSNGSNNFGGLIGKAQALWYNYPIFDIVGCWFDGTISLFGPRPYDIGGIIGDASGTTPGGNQYGNTVSIRNCHSHGQINAPDSSKNFGAICGSIYMNSGMTANIKNCYSDMVIIYDGSYTASNYICADGKWVSNCFYASDAIENSVNITFTVDGLTSFSADELASGALASALHKNDTETVYVWGQKIGTDPAPIITKDKSLVVNYCNAAFYSNGNLIKNAFINANNPIGTLPDPNTRLNQEFVKWVIKGTDTEVTADTVITGDMEIEAVFNTTYPLVGEGTEASPYLIGTITDFNTFSTICNQGDETYINAYYKVTDNLAFTESPVSCNTFKGIFDGNGKTLSFDEALVNSRPLMGTNSGTIKSLTINGYKIKSNNSMGIICMTNNGTIDNIRIENCSISQVSMSYGQYVGSVASNSGNGSVISNCVVTSTNLAGYYCGGIVGDINTSTVSHCTVEADNTFCYQYGYLGAYIGGIVAKATDSTIEYCANYANLDYKNKMPEISGGIVGFVESSSRDSIIKYCVNHGRCTAYSYASGIAGSYYNLPQIYFYIQNSVNCGEIKGEPLTPDSSKPTLSHYTYSNNTNSSVITNNVYHLLTLQFVNNFGTKITDEDITSGVFPYTFNQTAGEDAFTYKDSKIYIADSTHIATHKITVTGKTEATLYSDYTGKVTLPECTIEDMGYMFTSDGTDSGTKYTNDSVFTQDTTLYAILTLPTDENGTVLISNANQLLTFSDMVNGTNGFTANNALNAKLMADIDMAGLTWVTITSYSGTLDGNGFTIKNLNSANADAGARGLVGLLQTKGVIKNLKFNTVNVFVQASYRAAVIAGENCGLISGCTVENAVVQCGSYNCLAGIAASNNSTGTVENCSVLNSSFTRRFSGYGRTIGAVVDANNGIVKNCMSYGCTFGTTETALKGGVVTSGKAPTNSYFYTTNTTTSTVDGTAMTAAQFASGEVASMLQEGCTETTWGQGDGDTIPMLTTDDTLVKRRVTLNYNDTTVTQVLDYNEKFTFPKLQTNDGSSVLYWTKADGTPYRITEGVVSGLVLTAVMSYTKLVTVDNSVLSVDRTNNVISSEAVLNGRTVKDYKDNFKNDNSLILIETADGIALSDTEIAGTGCVIKSISELDGETVIDRLTIIISGDVNGDGLLNGIDYDILLSNAFNCALNGVYFTAADINKDGVIDFFDASLLDLMKSSLNGTLTYKVSSEQTLTSLKEHFGDNITVFNANGDVVTDTAELLGTGAKITYTSNGISLTQNLVVIVAS